LQETAFLLEGQPALTGTHGKEMNNKTSIQKTAQITDQDLYNRYSKLIYHVAWTMHRIPQYHLTEEDVHDIAQAAFVRLMALPQEKRNYPAAYHRTVINNACRTELKRILRHTDHITSYQNHNPDNDNVLYIDSFEDPKQEFEAATVAKLTVERCLTCLDQTAQQIVILAVGLNGNDPHPPQKIARLLKLPKPHVEETLNTSFEIMREAC
jgi:RNA polymerase sigma factor (sigma-70 family)